MGSSMRLVTRTALVMAATLSLVAGCAHTAGPRMEPAHVANEVGFPKCRVSVPLSQADVLQNARLTGVPSPETHIDWAKLRAAYRVGDQFRFVSCASGKHVGAPGYSFFGLFRGNSVALQMFQVIDN
jgi:hypothetical protein